MATVAIAVRRSVLGRVEHLHGDAGARANRRHVSKTDNASPVAAEVICIESVWVIERERGVVKVTLSTWLVYWAVRDHVSGSVECETAAGATAWCTRMHFWRDGLLMHMPQGKGEGKGKDEGEGEGKGFDAPVPAIASRDNSMKAVSQTGRTADGRRAAKPSGSDA